MHADLSDGGGVVRLASTDSVRVIGTRVLADGRLKVSRTQKSNVGLDG